MGKTIIIVLSIVSVTPALAQEEEPAPPPVQQPATPPPAPPEEPAPPPAGQPPVQVQDPQLPRQMAQTPVQVNGLVGIQLGGAVGFGDFSGLYGGQFALRLGAHIVIGPGLTLTPEVLLPFTVLVADGAGALTGISFGSRIGFDASHIVTPYVGFHVGFSRLQALSGGGGGINGLGFDADFGAEFWASQNVAIGPFFDLNFGSYGQGATISWLTFGPSVSIRY
jgi:hypothetical protein